jgi:single-strand DNA-binding protein
MQTEEHDHDLAWAAGFLDGEGHFGIRASSKQGYPAPFIEAGQVHSPEPIFRLQELFGGGVKQRRRTGFDSIWVWSLHGGEPCRRALPQLLPHLTVKRAEAGILFVCAQLVPVRGGNKRGAARTPQVLRDAQIHLEATVQQLRKAVKMPGFTINDVCLSGNTTRDAELRATTGGTSVCSIRLAVNDRYKDGNGDWADRPNYFDITIFGGMGEWAAKNIHKGDSVAVHGRLRWREWEKDGVKRQAVEVIADTLVPMRAGTSAPRENPNVRQAHTQDTDIPVDTDDLQPVYGTPDSDDVPFRAEPYRFEFDPDNSFQKQFERGLIEP